MYSGTWTTRPVSRVAGLVRALAEAAFIAGVVSVMVSTTDNGSSRPITESPTFRASRPSQPSVMNGSSSRISSALSGYWEKSSSSMNTWSSPST